MADKNPTVKPVEQAHYYRHSEGAWAESPVVEAGWADTADLNLPKGFGWSDRAHRYAAQLHHTNPRAWARYRSVFSWQGGEVAALEQAVRAEQAARRAWRRSNPGEDYQGPSALARAAAQWRGPYGIESVILDLDCSDDRGPAEIVRDLATTRAWLDQAGVGYQIFLSGNKGFHVEIHSSWFFGQLDDGRWVGLGSRTNLAPLVKRLVGLLSQKILGKPDGYDASFYRRGGSIRLQGVPREIKPGEERPRYKAPLTEERWAAMQALGGAVTKADLACWELAPWAYLPLPPTGSEALPPCGIRPLVALVAEAERWAEGAVTILRPELTARSEWEWVGAGAIFRAFGVAEGEATAVCCPFHRDEDPSAYLFEDGGLWCHACDRSWPADEVAAKKKVAGVVARKRKRSWQEEAGPSSAEIAEEISRKRSQLAALLRAALKPQAEGDALEDVVAVRRQPLRVIRSTTGLGKSHSLSQEIEALGGGVTVLTATEKLGGEYVERAAGALAHKRKPWSAEPRCETRESERTYEGVTAVGRAHLETAGELAEWRSRVCQGCPLFQDKSCKFWQEVKDFTKRAAAGEIAVAASANLAAVSSLRQVLGANKILVIDEDAMPFLLPQAHWDLAELEAEVARVDRSAHPWFEAAGGPKAWLSEVLSCAEAGAPWIAPTYRVEGIDLAAAALEGSSLRLQLEGEVASPAQRGSSLRQAKSRAEDGAKPVAAAWRAAKEEGSSSRTWFVDVDPSEIAPDGTFFLGQARFPNLPLLTNLLNTLRDHTDHLSLKIVEQRADKDSTRKTLILNKIAQVPDDVLVVLLDATLAAEDAELLGSLLGREVEIADLHAQNKKNQLIHDPSSGWSRSAVSEYRSKQRKWLTWFKDLVKEEGSGNVGVVARKGCPLGVAAAELVGAENVLTYQGLRGLNNLEDKRVLVLAGDPAPNELAYLLEATRRGLCGSPVAMAARVCHGPASAPLYRVNYSHLGPVADPAYRASYHAVMTAELIQAVGRLRPLQGEGRRIYLFSPHFPGEDVVNQLDYKLHPKLLSHVKLSPKDLRELGLRRGAEAEEAEAGGEEGLVSLLAEQQDRLAVLRELVGAGAKLGEIAPALGLSPGRVSQLAKECGLSLGRRGPKSK